MGKKPDPNEHPLLWCLGDCNHVSLANSRVWTKVPSGRVYHIIKKARDKGERTLATYCQACEERLRDPKRPKFQWPDKGKP